MNVIDYVTEEVSRQGHDILTLDGIERVGWMLDAWSYALVQSCSGYSPTIGVAIELGSRIEPVKNKTGLRTVGVRVGDRVCPNFNLVRPRLEAICARLQPKNVAPLKPLEFYREFETIHPFVDGNGRTGKILLNWINGTLLRDPIFPPDDFWGHPIRNP